MTKEECINALNRLSSGHCNDCEGTCENCVIVIFNKLINEHFEPKPYEYEDLKDEMWVWDDKEQICCEIGIDEDGLLMVYWYDDDLFNIKQMTCIEFEENRFYPLEKAREYENEAN